MKMIEIENLTFSYQKNGGKILNNLSLTCEAGTVNVLIGLNGSGKTTLIKIVAGLLDRYSGTVKLMDRDIRTLSIRERSKIMAYVSQRANNVDDFLVSEYLLFGAVNRTKFYQTPSKEEKENAEFYANKFGIVHLLDKKLGEISGGERQIVAICGAVIQNADLIVLDEPTSALDIRNQNTVLSIIKEIAEKEGKTFLLSSHNPNHALYLDGNVVVLKKGEIVEFGNAKDVISVEKLQDVYGDDICYSDRLNYREISFKGKGQL